MSFVSTMPSDFFVLCLR